MNDRIPDEFGKQQWSDSICRRSSALTNQQAGKRPEALDEVSVPDHTKARFSSS